MRLELSKQLNAVLLLACSWNSSGTDSVCRMTSGAVVWKLGGFFWLKHSGHNSMYSRHASTLLGGLFSLLFWDGSMLILRMCRLLSMIVKCSGASSLAFLFKWGEILEISSWITRTHQAQPKKTADCFGYIKWYITVTLCHTNDNKLVFFFRHIILHSQVYEGGNC